MWQENHRWEEGRKSANRRRHYRRRRDAFCTTNRTTSSSSSSSSSLVPQTLEDMRTDPNSKRRDKNWPNSGKKNSPEKKRSNGGARWNDLDSERHLKPSIEKRDGRRFDRKNAAGNSSSEHRDILQPSVLALSRRIESFKSRRDDVERDEGTGGDEIGEELRGDDA